MPDGGCRCFLYPFGEHQSFRIKFPLPENQLNPWLFDKEGAYFQPVTVLWQGGKKAWDLIKGEIEREIEVLFLPWERSRDVIMLLQCYLPVPVSLSHTQFMCTPRTCTEHTDSLISKALK